MSLTPETKAAIKSLDIIAIANQAGLNLDSANQCLCPFHADKDSPSCTFYSETSSFNCFGCEAGGDAISFIQKFYNYSFSESLKFAGIEQKSNWDDSKELFQNIWDNSKTCLLDAYLKKKQIDFIFSKVSDLRENQYKGETSLVIPIYDFDKNLQGIQLINSKSDKKIQGKYKGFFYAFSPINPTLPFYYFEGFADACTALKALSGQGNFIVCFNDGNIKNIVEIFYNKYPDSQHIVCSDNDADKPDNPGIMAALKAHDKFKCKIVYPGDFKDFNDLYLKKGIEAVKEKLLADMDTEYIEKVRVEAEKYKADKKAKQQAAKDEILSLPYSDLARADFFLKEHGENLKFSNTQNAWFIWNGRYWAIDEIEKHREFGKQTCKNISQLFKQFSELAESKKEKAELMKYANIAESKRTLDNFLNLARSDSNISIKIDYFDNDKWLFNCQNGTINLKTGELQQHDKNELHSKISPIEYDEKAACPLWIKFLNDIFENNQELIEFMQKSIGYSMTGVITEEVFWVFYGKGGNGKGTFISTIMNIFKNGHYGKQADFQTLFAPRNQQDDNILNQVAILKGSRFVTASEGAENAQLNENKIKELTSPDSGTVTGRFRYGNFFEYEPWYKIFLSSNYKPVIKGRDDGIWRRLMLIPFLKSFSKNEKDEKLKEKLKAESPGILNWMITGCLKWQKEGLNPPNIVLNATEEYKKDMDWLSEFFTDCCEINPIKNAPASDLYKKYLEWAGNIYSIQGRNTFYKAIKDRGFLKRKIGGNILVFQGISIIHDDIDTQECFNNAVKMCKFSSEICEKYNSESDSCLNIPIRQMDKCFFR